MAGRGRTTCRAIGMRRVFSDGKHPGLRELGPLRGEPYEWGPWLAMRAGGVSSLSLLSRSGDRGMFEQLRRRGTFGHLATRRRVRGEGRSFAPGRSARAAYLFSLQPVTGATGSGVVAAPASGVTKGESLRRSTCRRACSAGRRALLGSGTVRCPLTPKRVGYAHAASLRKR